MVDIVALLIHLLDLPLLLTVLAGLSVLVCTIVEYSIMSFSHLNKLPETLDTCSTLLISVCCTNS